MISLQDIRRYDQKICTINDSRQIINTPTCTDDLTRLINELHSFTAISIKLLLTIVKNYIYQIINLLESSLEWVIPKNNQYGGRKLQVAVSQQACPPSDT
jgi:transglutaminase/protease-like cytokinesis protein 3